MNILKQEFTIIGSGIAGLYAALKLAEQNKKVLLITKSSLSESNTRYAQGGIAGVLPENKLDSVDLHVKDTLKAGAGLSNKEMAEFISEKSASVINDLINYGLPFDRDKNNNLCFGLEGAHSVKRILHSGGDVTGKNMETILHNLVQNNPNISIKRYTNAVELLVNSDNTCNGLIIYDENSNCYEAIISNAVIIATGGAGQVYSNTTNPKIATGDGIAIAYKAGATIQDMEFIQFHPTALCQNQDGTRFLISEAVRGEGAILKNKNNEIFTYKYDNRGDLAPRDIVTRAIFWELEKTKAKQVYLDTSPIPEDKTKQRFPGIIKTCKENNIDFINTLVPVSPAAHYLMGGIKVNKEGHTSINNLFAIGETSCTSLHGANRLASNSLLECIVIANEVAAFINNTDFKNIEINDIIESHPEIDNIIQKYSTNKLEKTLNLFELTVKLKDTMWHNAGIVRSKEKLATALDDIKELKTKFNKNFKCANEEEYEFRNLLILAELIVKSALLRKESRGAHFRDDYPQQNSIAKHSYIQKGFRYKCQEI